MCNPSIFRECDIRGIADRDLPNDAVKHLGRAIGTFLQRQSGPRLVLGRDCRLSSPRLHQALLEGLLATGAQVTDIGIVPTPVLYFAAIDHDAHGAIIITGSHNPADYNGFKILSNGATLHGEDIQAIHRLTQTQDYLSGPGQTHTADAIPAYIDQIAHQFHYPRKLKVVIDSGSGTAGPVIGPLLARLNCDVLSLFAEMDGHFPHHHPDPTTPENLSALAAKVRETNADLGIGFDGDADRIGAVDQHGQPVYGDMLMLIYAREILTRHPGATIIGDVKCSQHMYAEIARLGGRPLMNKTGHSLIKARMKEEGALLAGELSGHMFFADRYHGFDDALYAACRLIEILANSGVPLSRQLDGLPVTVTTPEIRLEAPDEQKFDIVNRVAEHFRPTHKIDATDGARILFPHGWGLIRASNTQPAIVLRFEAESEVQLHAYRAEVEAALARESQ